MKHRIGCLAILIALVAPAASAQDNFLEKFALADDRAAVLGELIPGTEEYYYFHCLYYQHTGQLDKVEELLVPWIERHKRSARVREIQNRQALLRYESDPKGSLEYLRQEMGLRFSHQREVLGQKPSFPTALDPTRISRETLTKRALERQQYRETVAGFEDSALDLFEIEVLPDFGA